MKRIDKLFKKLSDLYEFIRKIEAYEIQEKGKGQKVAEADQQSAAVTGKPGDRPA
jgi:hypothetical protein